MTLSLIANTGIQFCATEFSVKPEESFTDAAGSFIQPVSILDESGFEVPLVFVENYDVVADVWRLDVAASFSDGQIVRLDDLRQHMPVPYTYIDSTTGKERLVDESKIDFSSLDLLEESDCYSEYCMSGSIRERLRCGSCALDAIEGEWLPVPMFERDSGSGFQLGPTGWCRMRIVPVAREKNVRTYRIVWAFDTTSELGLPSGVRPYFYQGDEAKRFAMCDELSQLFSFFSASNECEWVDSYIAAIIHGGKANTTLTTAEGRETHFQYVAYYVTLLNYLRRLGLTPETTLYSGSREAKNIDLVLDIGNSRTCGVLFEDADFTKADMLTLHDLSEPWKSYRGPFDMRLAFHRQRMGEMDIPGQFEWQSFVRVGEEAQKLIYRSRSADGVSQRTNSYSSPKRYLWDDRPFDGQWDFLTMEDEPEPVTHFVNIPGLSEQFDSDGSLRRQNDGSLYSSFSRRSLMTLVMIEIIQQARLQTNSPAYRAGRGDVDMPRRLRRIIITCPTAMSRQEQIALRQCAEDAYVACLRAVSEDLYMQSYDPAQWRDKIQIVPSVKDLSVVPGTPAALHAKAEWGYDEATSCQLVYLYAEVAQRYLGHTDDFFRLYGHVRPELAEDGYTRPALTVGSLDIGAGTTDIAICAYQYDENGVCRLTPKPLFWDSFYYAGDDLLEEIVRTFIIEGRPDGECAPWIGPIAQAVCGCYMSLSDEEFTEAFGLTGRDDLSQMNEAERTRVKLRYASRETSVRIHNFFGKDKAQMDYKDRLMRQDFNIQISVPMGIRLLDMLRRGVKSLRLTYADFFGELQPAQFIIDHFNRHFSLTAGGRTYVDFDFRRIEWHYDAAALSELIVSKMDPLLRQLSMVFSRYGCDIVLLAGKPTSLPAVADLLLKYYPVAPDRLIRLGTYRVGEWYPFADGLGYFDDQKSLVAVGAMIGFMASSEGLDGFHMDMSKMKRDMVSTANYMGLYNVVNQKVASAVLTPEENTATFDVHGFPLFIGCKQLMSEYYQARPIYALTLADGVEAGTVALPLRVSVQRNFSTDKEALKIVSAVDATGKPVSAAKLHFGVQSLAGEGAYWLDKGEFVLSING